MNYNLVAIQRATLFSGVNGKKEEPGNVYIVIYNETLIVSNIPL